MGEKNGGLWVIVIVVVLAGSLIFMLTQFYDGAIAIVFVPMMDELNEVGVRLGESLGDSGGEKPVAE